MNWMFNTIAHYKYTLNENFGTIYLKSYIYQKEINIKVEAIDDEESSRTLAN